MRRIRLTLLLCAGASTLLWRWDGSSELMTWMVCIGTMAAVRALATLLTPRPSPQGWTGEDIGSFALINGVQHGLTMGFGLGAGLHIRTSSGLAWFFTAVGICLAIAVPLHVWVDRKGLTKQRAEAQLVMPDVFD